MHFEPGFELECIKEVVDIGRDGQLIEKNVVVIDHTFWFGGRLNAMRQSVDPNIFASVQCPETTEECIAQIEAELPADGDASGLSPEQIARLIALAIKLLSLLGV